MWGWESRFFSPVYLAFHAGISQGSHWPRTFYWLWTEQVNSTVHPVVDWVLDISFRLEMLLNISHRLEKTLNLESSHWEILEFYNTSEKHSKWKMFHSHIYQISLWEESTHRPTSLFFKVIHTFKTYIFQVTVVIRVVEFIVLLCFRPYFGYFDFARSVKIFPHVFSISSKTAKLTQPWPTSN